jgi:hypothetical protein
MDGPFSDELAGSSVVVGIGIRWDVSPLFNRIRVTFWWEVGCSGVGRWGGHDVHLSP